MKVADVNNALIEGYLRLLENLSPNAKLDLISKLSLSVKTDFAGHKNSFFKSFGAWQSDKSSNEIISELRESRTFNRRAEEF